MTQIVYVNEYQPSSATLKLGGDPIYQESMDQEKLRVGAPSYLWIVPLLVTAAAVWYLWKKE